MISYYRLMQLDIDNFPPQSYIAGCQGGLNRLINNFVTMDQYPCPSSNINPLDYQFTLRRATQAASLKFEVEANFSPIDLSILYKKNRITPIFNNLSDCMLPAFNLSIDGVLLPRNVVKFHRQFLLQKIELSEQKESLMVAFPESRFCQLCRHSYHDYQKHIEGEDHKRRLKDSTIELFMDELIQQVGKVVLKPGKKAKKRHPMRQHTMQLEQAAIIESDSTMEVEEVQNQLVPLAEQEILFEQRLQIEDEDDDAGMRDFKAAQSSKRKIIRKKARKRVQCMSEKEED